MKKYLIFVPLLALPVLTGCAGTQVQRVDTAAVIDISGKWNDTDSRLTADEMIADCLARPWLGAAAGASGENPAVIVGVFRNQSSEHINTGAFVEDLQRALINSGRVNFVASDAERAQVRTERLDQDTNASEETKKAHGQELGADFVLSGSISTIEDKEGGKSVILYQVSLKLLDMKTNRIAWSGMKKIKKTVKRSSSSW